MISGGVSALFENTLILFKEYQKINQQLLNCSADIKEINTVWKHLSAVKSGRFAQMCVLARVECIILSDVPGDTLDSIASDPACADSSTSEDAMHVDD